MSSKFLAALDAEIQGLEAELEADPRFLKLRELSRVRHLYVQAGPVGAEHGRGGSFVFQTEVRRKTRRSSPERQRALDEAAKSIRGKTEPTKTADIYQDLQAMGVGIGGRDPQNNLSAMLYHSPRFKSHGRSGWTLVESAEGPRNAEAADANPQEGSSAASHHHRLTSDGTHSGPVEPVPGGGT